MPPNEKLTALLKLLHEDKNYAKTADVKRLFDELVAAVNTKGTDLSGQLKTALADIESRLSSSEKRISDTVSSASGASAKDAAALRAEAKALKDEIAWLKNALSSLPDILSEEHIAGMLEAFRSTIEIPEPAEEPTAVHVRDLLETLTEEERLDASAIKNLPEATAQAVEHFYGHTSLASLADVMLAGIVPGQSITWDGTAFIPYTPAGGGGTPVWGEDLTDQGPGTAFTLAHTPIAGTVRLFRGGAYQSVVQGDYSIVGDTITLATALSTGEVLAADYSYS